MEWILETGDRRSIAKAITLIRERKETDQKDQETF